MRSGCALREAERAAVTVRNSDMLTAHFGSTPHAHSGIDIVMVVLKVAVAQCCVVCAFSFGRKERADMKIKSKIRAGRGATCGGGGGTGGGGGGTGGGGGGGGGRFPVLQN
jgi:hypothetical protein